MKPEVNFTEILTQSNTLQTLVSKTEILTKINRIVQQKLDPSLSPHCRVTNVRDGILILTTPSPVWGHALRFCENELLSAITKDLRLQDIKSIQIRVCPVREGLQNSTHKLKAPKLSHENAVIIQSIAQTIPFSRLQTALLRLSQRTT